ncbi:hypothetical protein EIP86_003555 [Pleurotus ostreatoroseus]|nr:hypothetical protein EIP86_003555 [Pleurotus ostreatoroseus]
MTVDDIQYLCNILGDFPELLVQFAFFLPPDRRFTLSPDFEQTRLVLIRQGAKNVRRRASFGLIDGHINGDQAQSACVHVCHLLNSVFQEEDREEAVLTLRGDDAQCAISHIQQQLVEVESSWTKFVSLVSRSEASPFGGDDWQRAQKLSNKLAAFSDQASSPVRLEGLKVDVTSTRNSTTADVLVGQYLGRKVAVKRLRVFGTTLKPVQTKRFHEASFFSQRDIYVNRMLEIAEGLSYLHKAGLVHGALRGHNVLINERYDAILSDFDFRLYYVASSFAIAAGFPYYHDLAPRWYAPEFWRLDPDTTNDPNTPMDYYEDCRVHLTKPLDIYGFGCVCVEIYSEQPPQFQDTPPDTEDEYFVIPLLVMNGARPIRPEKLTSDVFWAFIERCWEEQPSDRPTIEEVQHELPTCLP